MSSNPRITRVERAAVEFTRACTALSVADLRALIGRGDFGRLIRIGRAVTAWGIVSQYALHSYLTDKRSEKNVEAP